MTQRVAIIGCGYVGSALGEALVSAGHDVIGTTTSNDRADRIGAKGIQPAIVHVADVDRLHEILADRDIVFLTVAPKSTTVDYRDVYLQAAKNLIKAARGTPVTRIIYTSSTRVYRQDRGHWVDETSPAKPNDERGEILVASERMLLDGGKTLGSEENPKSKETRTPCTTVVRLSGIYGPDRDPKRRILGAAGTQRDDGEVWVNMIHRDDIVSALTKLLDVAHHGVLTLSDDQPTKRSDYYDRVLEQAMLPPIRWIRGALSPKRGKRISNETIKGLLNLTLKHPTH